MSAGHAGQIIHKRVCYFCWHCLLPASGRTQPATAVWAYQMVHTRWLNAAASAVHTRRPNAPALWPRWPDARAGLSLRQVDKCTSCVGPHQIPMQQLFGSTSRSRCNSCLDPHQKANKAGQNAAAVLSPHQIAKKPFTWQSGWERGASAMANATEQQFWSPPEPNATAVGATTRWPTKLAKMQQLLRCTPDRQWARKPTKEATCKETYLETY